MTIRPGPSKTYYHRNLLSAPWPEAVNAAVYVTNRTSTQRDAQPPRAKLIKHLTSQDETIDISNLRRFGCVAYLYIPAERRLKSAKFQPRAVKGYLVGYQRGGHTNYRIWNPDNRQIKESPHVTFDETTVYADVYQRGNKTTANAVKPPLEEVTETRSTDDTEPDAEPDGDSAMYPNERNSRTQLQQDTISDSEETDDDTIVVAPIQISQPSTSLGKRRRESRDEDHRRNQDNRALDRRNSGTANNAPGNTSSEITRAQGVPDATEHSTEITSTQGGSNTEHSTEITSTQGGSNTEHRTTRQLSSGNRKTYEQYRTRFGPYAQIAYAMMAVERDPSLHEPSSFQEAISAGESSHWQASMKREVKQLEEQGAWKVVSELPLGRKLIKGRWVYKKKLNPDNTIKEYKSRWVVKGFMQQEGVDYFDTYAATLFPTTFRSVFSLVASRGWKLYQMDVTGAFLHSLIDSEIYMEPPEGFYQKGLICKMEKSIYGLKQAPYLWFESLSKVLTDLGYHSLQSDRCCFTNDAKDVIILVFVDDIQVTGPNTKAIEDLQTGLKAYFKIKDIEPDTYLGLHIERNGNSLRLHQASYTQRILKRFGFDKAKKVPTPMTDHSLQSHEGESNIDIKRTYLEAIGSLLFLANRTRPDIEFGVNFLARFSNNPSSEHWAAVKRIFRYLAGTIDLGIHYQEKPGERFLFGYCDADFAGDLDHRKSTSGYLFILGGGPISWKSQLQRAVTLSTTEAEYAALTEATRESNSIRQLLIELGLPTNLLQPVPILEDNTSTISLASNHSNHKRSKHIDIRNHYCREQSTIGNIKVEYVNTEEQAADSLTKPLGPQKWKTVIEQLRLRTGITTS
jgi:hypothetical protein